jgi:hypothetical protein
MGLLIGKNEKFACLAFKNFSYTLSKEYLKECIVQKNLDIMLSISINIRIMERMVRKYFC